MGIAIICGYPFPEGMAATTRIISYSKGLVENDADVDVILFNPTEGKDIKYQSKGIYEGIKYCYPFRKNRISNRFLHMFEIAIGIIMTFIYIIKENKKQKFKALIISNDNIIYLYIFGVLSKIIRSKSIFIFDEFPIPIRKYLKDKLPNYKTLLYSIALKKIDAYIAMTENLSNFYNEISVKPSFILSTTIDISRFEKIKESKSDKLILCYMGNMELKKDNIDNIISACYLINKNYPDLELHLYGTPPTNDKIYLENLISKYNLKDRVYLKGRAEYNNVPQILKNATILVTSQPNTKRAEGGFPTKLGEYLAAKIPCLLTDVGEINKYVQDLETVFLCPPESSEKYAEKLDFILKNYSFAQEVAMRGYFYLINNFSNKAVSKELLSFIKTI